MLARGGGAFDVECATADHERVMPQTVVQRRERGTPHRQVPIDARGEVHPEAHVALRRARAGAEDKQVWLVIRIDNAHGFEVGFLFLRDSVARMLARKQYYSSQYVPVVVEAIQVG